MLVHPSRFAALALTLLLACHPWSRRDGLMEAGFVLLTVADTAQTAEITRQCKETNPVIGQCGQRVPLGFYFPAVLILHALATSALSGGARLIWQSVTLGAEGATVWTNYRSGTGPWLCRGPCL